MATRKGSARQKQGRRRSKTPKTPLSSEIKKAQAARQKRRAQLDKEYKKRKAALDKEYRKRLRELERIGAYSPTGRELTKSRKSTIASRFKQFEQFIRGDLYVYVPFPTRSKKTRRQLKKLSTQNQLATTQKGVLMEKPPGFKSADFVFNKRTKTYRIKIKRTRKGPTGKRDITELVPIEPMGTMEAELERIKIDADEIGPLGKNESIAFKVSVNGGEGYSHYTFSNPEKLIEYLDERYENMQLAFKLQFFRSVTVVKTKTETWATEHPIKPFRRVNKMGRSDRFDDTRRTVKDTKEYKEGYAAGVSRRPKSSNPYEKGSASAALWDWGYEDGYTASSRSI